MSTPPFTTRNEHASFYDEILSERTLRKPGKKPLEHEILYNGLRPQPQLLGQVVHLRLEAHADRIAHVKTPMYLETSFSTEKARAVSTRRRMSLSFLAA